jgi:phosphoenolpyruvate-protein kinase (PTS system EI component)
MSRCSQLGSTETATAAYLADDDAEPFVVKSGHRVDVAKAIDMHPQAKKLLADSATSSGLRRTMVMTAVIMGFLEEG